MEAASQAEKHQPITDLAIQELLKGVARIGSTAPGCTFKLYSITILGMTDRPMLDISSPSKRRKLNYSYIVHFLQYICDDCIMLRYFNYQS